MPASYSLGNHFEQFIRRQVQSGRFASASEVVREGLRLVEEREEERAARLEALRTEIARGRESGPGIPADEVFAGVRGRIDEVSTAGKRAAWLRRAAGPNREEILRRLRAHEAELKAMGVKHLSLFGSVARGETGPASDIDLAAELDRERKIDLFRYGEIAARLEDLLEAEMDLVTEPARKPRLQAEIDRDRVHVF